MIDHDNPMIKRAWQQAAACWEAGRSAFNQNANLHAIFKLISGTALGQILTILVTPILTRQYEPDDFGIYGAVLGVSMILAVAANMKYDLAIVMERDNDAARDLLSLVCYSSLVFGVFLGLAITALKVRAPHLTLDLGPPSLLWQGIILILCIAIHSGVLHWGIRHKRFGTIAKATLLGSVCMAVVNVFGAELISASASTLVWGSVASSVAQIAFLWTKLGSKSNPGYRLREVQRLACRYRDLPIYRGPQALVNSIFAYAPPVALAALFGPVIAGAYWLAHRALAYPGAMLAEALRKVLFERYSRAYEAGEGLRTSIVRFTWLLMAVSIIPFAVVTAGGPFLFEVVFGADWRYAGEIARWLSVVAFLALANVPSVVALTVRDQHRTLLVWAERRI